MIHNVSFLVMTLFIGIFNTEKSWSQSSTGSSTSSISTESTSTLPAPQQGKYEENQQITDAKLRADAGSLSKYSLSFNLSYNGPGVGDLSAKDQPNPDGVPGSFQTSLSGSFGFRYRFDSSSSLRLSTGLKTIYPLHGAERTDINNPKLSYDKSFKINTVQIRNALSVSGTTNPDITKYGQVAALSYDFYSVYNIGTSGFATGLDFTLDNYIYDREYKKSDRKASRYGIGIYPNLKYNFNDKLSANTSWAISYFNQRANENQWNFDHRTITQRVGLGYAYTRDIYLSPYLNIYPGDLRSETSTINLSSTFSLF